MERMRLVWPLMIVMVTAVWLLVSFKATAVTAAGAAAGQGGGYGLAAVVDGGATVSKPVSNGNDLEAVAGRLDLDAYGHTPLAVPDEAGGATGLRSAADPASPFATVVKTGPTAVQPGRVVNYQVHVANYEAISHTYQLTIPLPLGLTYLPGAADDLNYDAAGRTLSRQITLPPGHLDYDLTANGLTLPYLDLADFGLPNLCDAFFAQGQPCAGASVTFNLGISGRYATLYGQPYYQLTVSTDGQILVGSTLTNSHSAHHRLPDTAVPGLRLAGLWRAADMGQSGSSTNGRWHAAIISGLIANHDLFYVQWHNTPSATNANLTARHAVALVVDSGTTASPLSGHIFYIYDNISDPDQMVATGYTIGLSDPLGRRGLTHAYAPGSTGGPPQGYPPAAGTTLHLRPVLWGGHNAYRQTVSYQAVANGPIPSQIVTTAYATPNDPALPSRWASHYLALRYQHYLPLVTTASSSGGQP